MRFLVFGSTCKEFEATRPKNKWKLNRLKIHSSSWTMREMKTQGKCCPQDQKDSWGHIQGDMVYQSRKHEQISHGAHAGVGTHSVTNELMDTGGQCWKLNIPGKQSHRHSAVSWTLPPGPRQGFHSKYQRKKSPRLQQWEGKEPSGVHQSTLFWQGCPSGETS